MTRRRAKIVLALLLSGVMVALAVDNLTVNNVTVPAGPTQYFQAKQTITVSNFTVESGGNAIMRAGNSITLGGNIQVFGNLSVEPSLNNNQAPVPADQIIYVVKNSSGNTVLTATDVEGDVVESYSIGPGGNVQHGNVVGAWPSITYTPNQGYEGKDVFNFVPNDLTPGSVEGNVTFIVLTVPNDTIHLEFNEKDCGEPADATTNFTDTQSSDIYKLVNKDGGAVSEVSFRYNEIGGTALRLGESSSGNIVLTGGNVIWSERFIIETLLRKYPNPAGGLTLVQDIDTVNGDVLKLYADASGNVHLDLNQTALQVVSSEPIIKDVGYTFIRVAVDLSQATSGNAVKMYRNASLVALANPAAAVSGVFLVPTNNPIEMFHREANYRLEVDFFRIIQNATATGNQIVAGFYNGERYVDGKGSLTFFVDGPDVIKRVSNTNLGVLDEIQNGAQRSVVLDAYPTTPGVFPGIFQIRFAAEAKDLYGAVAFDILFKTAEPGAQFEKIGEIQRTFNGARGSVKESEKTHLYYYWDSSRVVPGGWNGRNYRTDQKCQLKFKLRNFGS